MLVLREGARDWLWKASIHELDVDEVKLDIHHIFPRNWCRKRGIPMGSYDSILNKTPLSYKANRKIGGEAPSAYLPKIQSEKHLQLSDQQMDALLESHALNPALLRADDYEAFIADRRRRLSALVSKAMGKPVSQIGESEVYEEAE